MIQITMNNDTMKYGQKLWNLVETLLGRARPLAHYFYCWQWLHSKGSAARHPLAHFLLRLSLLATASCLLPPMA